MEPARGRDFAFAVDVSATYPQKRAAINEYGSIFKVDSPTVFLPAIHA